MRGDEARLRLKSGEDAYALVELLRHMDDTFSIVSRTGSRRVNAKSILGVICMMLEFLDSMYLINETHEGLIPPSLAGFLATPA